MDAWSTVNGWWIDAQSTVNGRMIEFVINNEWMCVRRQMAVNLTTNGCGIDRVWTRYRWKRWADKKRNDFQTYATNMWIKIQNFFAYLCHVCKQARLRCFRVELQVFAVFRCDYLVLISVKGRVRPSVHLSIHVSIHPFVHLSVHPFLCP